MHDPCEGIPAACGVPDESAGEPPSRRAFLREGLIAVAALTALGVSTERLQAMERVFATGSRSGDLLRYPLPAADGATIDRANRLILARYQGHVYAFDVECPHRGTDVQWQGNRDRFYCPKHKSTFRPEGSLIRGKAARGLDRHPVRRAGDEIVVDTGVTIRSTDADAWAAASLSL